MNTKFVILLALCVNFLIIQQNIFGNGDGKRSSLLRKPIENMLEFTEPPIMKKVTVNLSIDTINTDSLIRYIDTLKLDYIIDDNKLSFNDIMFYFTTFSAIIVVTVIILTKK